MSSGVIANLKDHVENDARLSDETLRRVTVGRSHLVDFLNERYLQEFIPLGGGKVKLVQGGRGRGKSHFLAEVGRVAGEFGYVVSQVDARVTPIHEFQNLYRSVAAAIHPEDMLQTLYHEILRESNLVDDPESLSEPIVDVWRREGTEGLYARVLRKAVESVFKDKNLNRSFATAIALGVTHLSGLQRLTDPEWEALQRWLLGEPLPKRETRSLRIYQRVDRFTGRDLLRSWAELATSHLDKKGILILVDNLETLLTYSKLKRDAAYENLRQFIDDVDQASYVFMLVAGEDDLRTNQKRGLYSYQALWQRLSDEITIRRPNRFADLINLDQYELTEEELRELARQLCLVWEEETGAAAPAQSLVSRRVNEAQAGAGQYVPPGNLVRSLLQDFEGRRA